MNPVTNKTYFTDFLAGEGMTNWTRDRARWGQQQHLDHRRTRRVGVVALTPVSNKIVPRHADSRSNDVTVIDGATGGTATVSAGAGPDAIDVDPGTNRIYVANSDSNNVTVIDGASNATWTVGAGTKPVAIVVNPVTHLIYVANSGSNMLTAIDGANNTTWTYSVGTDPVALAVNPASNRIYVVISGSNSVTIIDGATGAISTVGAGTGPDAVAVNPVTNRIYVANYGSNNVTVIDGRTNTCWAVNAGFRPTAVVVNPVTNLTYVTNQGGWDTVTQKPSFDMTVISPYTHLSVPLTTVLTGATDAQTIAGNAVFSTSNDSPSFSAVHEQLRPQRAAANGAVLPARYGARRLAEGDSHLDRRLQSR